MTKAPPSRVIACKSATGLRKQLTAAKCVVKSFQQTGIHIVTVIKMLFAFGKFKLEIDAEKTKAFYESAETVSQGCTCGGCRNFELAVDTLPSSVKAFFRNLGIDMRKVRECYVNCTNPDGTLLYGGFYHICGALLEGESAWQKSSEGIASWHPDAAFPLSDEFRVSFQNDIDLLEPQFPLPVVQLEFSASLPWVLDGENPYPKAHG